MQENYISGTIPAYPPGFKPTKMSLDEAHRVITATVCDFYGLRPEELKQGKNATEEAEMAMHVIRYFLKDAGMGVRQIKRITAGDAHNSLKKVEGYLEVDERVKGEIQTIKQRLRA